MCKIIESITFPHLILVSDCDYEWLNSLKWYRYQGNYFNTYINGKYPSIYKLIMQPPHGFEVDHINRFRFDNRRENLRIVTRSQNHANKKSKTGSTSQYKGVHWDKSRNKWVTVIRKNRRNYHCGRFDNEVDAALAYNKKAKELFGKFAYLNRIIT